MQLLYFARVREQVGLGAESVTLPASVTTVGQLLDWLASRSPRHAAALADRSRIRVAVDQEFAQPETLLSGAAEVAIFPPVTGG